MCFSDDTFVDRSGNGELAQKLQDRLGARRYWTYVDRHTGRIFPRWRARGKEDNRKRCIEADTISKANRVERIPYSCSSTISRWGSDSVDKIALWQLWHRRWMYSEVRPRAPPQNMLLPTNAVIPANLSAMGKRKRDARSSADLPSTDDEIVEDDDNMERHAPLDSSSDECSWSF